MVLIIFLALVTFLVFAFEDGPFFKSFLGTIIHLFFIDFCQHGGQRDAAINVPGQKRTGSDPVIRYASTRLPLAFILEYGHKTPGASRLTYRPKTPRHFMRADIKVSKHLHWSLARHE